MTAPIILMSAADAATMLGVTAKTIYKWVKTGRLTPRWQAATHTGPHPQYLFDRDDVVEAGKLLNHAAQELGRRQRASRTSATVD